MKREIIKISLIGLIVAGLGGTIIYVLPEYFDLETEKVTYTGFPTYACTEPFEVTSCLNRTALQSFMFNSDGMQVVDLGFKLP